MKLTPAMREFLGKCPVEHGGPVLYDALLSFMREFGLDKVQAGRLIAKWMKEVY